MPVCTPCPLCPGLPRLPASPVLQGYDFVHMRRHYGVRVQVRRGARLWRNRSASRSA